MGILDGVVEWIATQVMNILDMINTSVLGALGCDMETFLRYFPAAETFYNVIVATAVGLLLLNLVFQLFRNFGIISGGEAESPIGLTVRTGIFLFLTLYADDILNMVLRIGGTPFQWLMTEDLPPLNFADFNSVLLTILGVSLNGSIALIALILLVILAWNYLKLLFEAAERYVLLGVLVYTSPMAFSMGGSQNTVNIFRSWCRMLGGQIFMVIMNVWCLRIFTSMFANFISNPLSLENGNFLIWFLCTIGFLKASQKIDNFVQMLGINVGRTGGSMVGEAAIALRTLGRAGYSPSAKGRTSSADTGLSGNNDSFLQGGLAGAVGRQFNRSAVSNITGKSDSIASNIARSVYNSSIHNGGGFSNSVISTVAHGDIAKTGSIKGSDATQAFQSYMGIGNAVSSQAIHSSSTAQSFSESQNSGDSSVINGSDAVSVHSDGAFADMQTSAQQVMTEYQQNTGEVFEYEAEKLAEHESLPNYGDTSTAGIDNQVPFSKMESIEQETGFYAAYPLADRNSQFSGIEIGGGRITGIETSDKLGGSLAFAMYSTEKYMPPSKGDFKTVTAADGTKWYHQYAQPTVIKEPYMKEDGKIQYNEHIENKLPDMPKRKDRI